MHLVASITTEQKHLFVAFFRIKRSPIGTIDTSLILSALKRFEIEINRITQMETSPIQSASQNGPFSGFNISAYCQQKEHITHFFVKWLQIPVKTILSAIRSLIQTTIGSSDTYNFENLGFEIKI